MNPVDGFLVGLLGLGSRAGHLVKGYRCRTQENLSGSYTPHQTIRGECVVGEQGEDRLGTLGGLDLPNIPVKRLGKLRGGNVNPTALIVSEEPVVPTIGAVELHLGTRLRTLAGFAGDARRGRGEVKVVTIRKVYGVEVGFEVNLRGLLPEDVGYGSVVCLVILVNDTKLGLPRPACNWLRCFV